MAKQVIRWQANDGSLFETENEANRRDREDYAVERLGRLFDRFDLSDRAYQYDVINMLVRDGLDEAFDILNFIKNG
jgi:hypothetical protein